MTALGSMVAGLNLLTQLLALAAVDLGLLWLSAMSWPVSPGGPSGGAVVTELILVRVAENESSTTRDAFCWFCDAE